MRRATPVSRAYSAAHFLLELDQSENAGFIRAVEGGGIRSDIVTYRSGDSNAILRQQGSPRYEDLKMQVGMSMSKSFYLWIEGFVSGQVLRKSGAIVAGDFQYKERARRTFRDAIISELTLPKFDAADRTPCYLGVTLAPERIDFSPGSAIDLPRQVGTKQKLWSPNKFSFSIDGFEEATRRTMKVDSFSIRQQIHEYRSGEFKDPLRVPGRVEMPNVAFYIPESDAGPLVAHFAGSVVAGRRAPGRMTGHLTAHDNDGNTLVTIDLLGLEIASIGPDKSDATSQEIKQVRVEVATEGMKFHYAAHAVE